MWRSAILPGWGQAYNGQDTKAWILGGATVGLFAGLIGSYIWCNNAENDYLNLPGGLSSDRYDNAYSNWENAANTNHTVYFFFGLAYLYNLYDAMVNVRAMGEMRAQDPVIKVSFNAEGVRARVELARF